MIEHFPQLNITQSELAPLVSSYFDTLLVQRDAILARYNLTPETAEKFCDLHSSDEDREKMFALYEKIDYVIEHKQIPSHLEKQEKYRLAREIMKEEFLGIEAIEKTFNIHLAHEDIPEIPFTFEDLNRAKELGQFLILRVDKTDDGTPLTIEHMEKMFSVDEDGGQGAVHFIGEEYRNEDFFTQEIPRCSWALVSKDIIENSTNENYLDQTAILVEYLKHNVFAGMHIPAEYQSAIEEFERSINDIQQLMNVVMRSEASQKLEALTITKLLRHTPVEAIYDLMVYFHHTGTTLWEGDWIWTSRWVPDGRLVDVGNFDLDGAAINSDLPDMYFSYLGCSFSRNF